MSTLKAIPSSVGSDSSANPKPTAVPLSQLPAEKFQSVMERLSGHCPSENLQVTTITIGNCPLSAARQSSEPFAKNGETGITDSDKASPVSKRNPAAVRLQIKSDFAPGTDTTVPLDYTVPVVAELSNVQSPAIITKNADGNPPKSQPETEEKSAGNIAVCFDTKKRVNGNLSSLSRAAQLLSTANSKSAATVQNGQNFKPADSQSASIRNQLILSTPPEKSAESGNKAALTEIFNPQDDEKSLSSPTAKSDEVFTAPAMENMGENQKQPATIIISVGSSAVWDGIPDSLKLNDGTPVAQQDMSMKMSAKKTSFTEATKQKFPSTVASAAGGNVSGHLDHADEPAPLKNSSDPVLAISTGMPPNAAAAKTVSQEALNTDQSVSIGTPALERTREMLALEVVRLHENGADELRLVIKPDAGTQLSLNLQQRNDGVEVRAILDRGNFDLLNRHWPELQQQLEARGVRVAPLSCAEHFFGGGSEGFRQPTTPNGQTAGDDAEQVEAPAVLVSGLPTATATASASVTLALNWETWA